MFFIAFLLNTSFHRYLSYWLHPSFASLSFICFLLVLFKVFYFINYWMFNIMFLIVLDLLLVVCLLTISNYTPNAITQHWVTLSMKSVSTLHSRRFVQQIVFIHCNWKYSTSLTWLFVLVGITNDISKLVQKSLLRLFQVLCNRPLFFYQCNMLVVHIYLAINAMKNVIIILF